MNAPLAPEPHAIFVLLLTVGALILFTRERIPLESSSLFILSVLAAMFELFPFMMEDGSQLRASTFFSGFGHEALVAVCALMIMGQGLVRTGALEPVGRSMSYLWGVSPKLSFLVALLVAGALSAFVNNTPIVVLLLPILTGVSIRTGSPASGVLMPMGLATIIGGMSTTIGTSTNLLVVSVAADMGMRRLGMFDFALPVLMAGGIGILYLWLIAPLLLPRREPLLGDASPRLFDAQLIVPDEGFAHGETLLNVSQKVPGLRVRYIQRSKHTRLMPLPDVRLRTGDRLMLRDTPQNLKEYEQVLEATLYTGQEGSIPVDEEHPLTADDQQLAEIVITRGSILENTTLRSARFADRYQLATLALHHAGEARDMGPSGVGDVTLQTGDVMLVQGPREQIATLKRSGELLVLDATTDLPFTRKAPIALATMAGTVTLAALGILPIAVSALAGALLMIKNGCLGWKDATRALSAQVILIVVVSLALGVALLKTGAADFLAGWFIFLVHGNSHTVILSALMLVMALATNVVSNNAAAVIGTPIAIGIADRLGLQAEPFVLAVLFGANMSFATPMAYTTNLLVMNAGGYTFGDFVRIGLPLTIILWLAFSWLLPTLYNL